MRLLVISNRLPVTITKDENGWNYAMSSGGLVSALSGLKKETSFTWFGWPGMELPPEDQKIGTYALIKFINSLRISILVCPFS
jgi:trehalose-6-phosphate synthase